MPTKKDSPTKLGLRRREIMATIKALEAEKAEIDAKLLSLDTSEEFKGDGVIVSYTPVRGLDNAIIQKRFPASKRPEFYKLALDVTEFRKHFSPHELETYEKISYRINVKDA